MINTFLSLGEIYSILKNSQDNPTAYDFALDSSLDLRKYDPGDFRIDGHVAKDGVYLYFEKTEFQDDERALAEFGHSPKIVFDVYSSRPARETASGDVVSAQAAYDSASAAIISVFGCVFHSTFNRILNEALDSVPTFGDTRVTQLYPVSCENIATLKLTENSKSVSIFRLSCEFAVTELPGQAIPFAIGVIEDRLHAMRDESDVADV